MPQQQRPRIRAPRGLQAKQHTLRTSLPAGPVELDSDRERLIPILCNLIGNAAKYTPAGGQIDLTVAAEANRTLEISVKDNGIGIPPAKAHRDPRSLRAG